jgi:DNA-binding NarL/FixJ family response regulator
VTLRRIEDVGIVIRVQDRAAELAAFAALEHADIRVVPDRAPSGVAGVRIATSNVGEASLCVIVTPATAAACAAALGEVLGRRVAGVLTCEELDRLPATVHGVAAGILCVSPRTVVIAADMPEISDRGRVVLELAATGASVPEIAARLGVSSATVKRELSDLAALCGVSSRVELILRARTLGLL